MKKILLTAVAALAIVGCSQNEEIENVGQKVKIDVTTAVKGTTRAAVTNNDNFTAFTVSGYTVAVADIAGSGVGSDAYMYKDYTGKKVVGQQQEMIFIGLWMKIWNSLLILQISRLSFKLLGLVIQL